MEELSSEQRESLRDILLQNEKDVSQELEQAKASHAPVELDQQSVGRVSRIDAIQQEQMKASNIRRLEVRLKQIKSALARIDSEDFGLCQVCEEPISFKRLQARPESPTCLECASRAEKT